MDSPAEPLVSVKLGNETVKFLVDTGATYLVLNSCKGPMSKFSMPVIGATGKREVKPFFQPIECEVGNRVLTHEFLYMPECPLPLMGRDLLNKLGAQITFDKNKVKVHIPQNNAWKAQAYMLQKALDSEQVENQ